MAEILAELDSAFAADADIDEIDVILDMNPPFIVLVEHKLGIAAPALKPLLKHVLTEFYHFFNDDSKAAEIDFLNAALINKAISLTRAILCIRGNFPLAFSLRKKLIVKNAINPRHELKFLDLLFTKHPKCPSSWEHRRWCLQNLQQSQQPFSQTKILLTEGIIEQECKLCTAMAEKYPKNYYAWVHRLWLLDFMTDLQLSNELSHSKKWLLSHVSDHCASNHRLQVILRLITRSDHSYNDLASGGEPEKLQQQKQYSFARTEFITYLLMESEVMIQARPGSETLWYHRRDIAILIVDMLLPTRSPSSSSSSSSSHSNYGIHCNTSSSSDSSSDHSTTNCSESIVSTGRRKYIVDAMQAIARNTIGKATSFSASPTDQMQQQENNEASLHWEVIGDVCSSRLLPYSAIYDFVVTWILYEFSFCKRCAEEPCMWNTEQQRIFSIRYYTYLLINVIERINKLTERKETEMGTKDEKDKIEEITDIELNTRQLRMCLQRAVAAHIALIASEDKLERCWKYLMEKYDPSMSLN